MYKRQKIIIFRLVTVMTITVVSIFVMIHFRNYVNRTEAMRAMKGLSVEVLKYRESYGSVPPEKWVESKKKQLPGYGRLGIFRYRARWIKFDSGPDEILGYTEGVYRWIFSGRKHLVLRLSGVVEWIGVGELESILTEQQSLLEIELTGEAKSY